MIQLRPYQSRAVNALRAHMREGRRRLLLVAPTGAGKTVIAAHVVTSALERGTRTIFVAHRRELINQTYAKLIADGIPESSIGIMMGDDKRAKPGAPVQVASIATLHRREHPESDLLIIDEAHRSLARSYLEAISHYADRGVVLGLTATPYRADGGGLGDVYEVLEVVSSPCELIAEGFLVEPRLLSVPRGYLPDLSKVRTTAGEYNFEDLSKAMNQKSLVGNLVEHWQKWSDNRKTVVFATSVAHSKAIVDQFTEAGIAAAHLDGETSTEERDNILGRLERGELDVVSNCGVLCEGWDMPSVKCAVLARPTKSTGLYLQQAGRILRPWNNVPALILDHAGNVHRHGFPQDTRAFTLDPKHRNASEYSAPTKNCPECETVVHSSTRKCPQCGFEWASQTGDSEEIAFEDGELEELRHEDVSALVSGWNAIIAKWEAINAKRRESGIPQIKRGYVYHSFVKRFRCKPPASCKLPVEIADEQTKADAFEALLTTARERGYRAGWAAWKYHERFGHWPTKRAS